MVVCSREEETSGTQARRTTAVLECSYCRRKFLNEADRHLHIREAHLGMKDNFECKQCGKRFGNRHILQLHTRLHASQSSITSPDLGISDTVTVTSTTQTNGSLNINFNVSLNINLSDGLDSMDLDSKLNELLANATKASFHEALRREKKLASQLKNDILEASKSSETSPSKSSDTSEGDMSTKLATAIPTPTTNSSVPDTVISKPPPCKIQELPKPMMIPSPKPPVRVNPHNRPKKSVGLTKIRMEDCQRCDACSCIYLDERDYIKHMKNFHKQDVIKQEPIKPRHKPRAKAQASKRRSKRQQQLFEQHQQQIDQAGKKGNCRSCCKQCKCRGDHGTLEPMLPIVRPVLGRSGRRSSSTSTQESWNQFAQHLEGVEGVVLQPNSAALAQMKSESDHMPDFSDLLSQVEVKIKTEPVDHDELPVKVKLEPSDDGDSDTCSVY